MKAKGNVVKSPNLECNFVKAMLPPPKKYYFVQFKSSNCGTRCPNVSLTLSFRNLRAYRYIKRNYGGEGGRWWRRAKMKNELFLLRGRPA